MCDCSTGRNFSAQVRSYWPGLSTLQQNVSDVMEAIATIASNLDHNANDIDLVNQLPLQIQEQLLMFQQNVSDVMEPRTILPLILIVTLMISTELLHNSIATTTS